MEIPHSKHFFKKIKRVLPFFSLDFQGENPLKPRGNHIRAGNQKLAGEQKLPAARKVAGGEQKLWRKNTLRPGAKVAGAREKTPRGFYWANVHILLLKTHKNRFEL